MNKKLLGLLLYSSLLQAQIGMGSEKTMKDLHENDSFKKEKTRNVREDANTEIAFFHNNDALETDLLDPLSLHEKEEESISKENKSLIYVNGQYVIPQKITVQMTADFMSAATTGFAVPIGNLNNEIVDNENSYAGTATANSFKVYDDGVYEVSMTVQMSTVYGATPRIGIWDNNAMQWLASVKNTCTTPKNKSQTYNLTTSIPLVANHIYSFRASNKFDFTIKNLPSGGTSSDLLTQVSVRQIK